jgi:hypothetical protein
MFASSKHWVHHGTKYYSTDNKTQKMTVLQAKKLLKLTSSGTSDTFSTMKNGSFVVTMKELRYAYFAAAKLCHPDMLSSRTQQQSHNNVRDDEKDDDGNDDSVDSGERFRLVTDAYELLQEAIVGLRRASMAKKNQDNDDDDDENVYDEHDTITEKEEQIYRRACWDVLGLPAEIVEEAKQTPQFREWLQGRTDAAIIWQSFLLQHGGLAPQLRCCPTSADHSSTVLHNVVSSSNNAMSCMSSTRRKRRR